MWSSPCKSRHRTSEKTPKTTCTISALDMERPVNYRRWFFIRPPGEVVQVAVQEALRQLITQIFAGRCPIIVIRRELPRTICAGWSIDLFSFPWAPRPQPVPPPLSFASPKIFKLCRWAQCFSLFGLHFHPNGSDESQQFASYCGDHLSGVLTPRHELSVAAVQAVLCLPGDLLDLFTHSLLPLAQACGYRRRAAVGQAASTTMRRRCTFPVLVMPPLLRLSPLECSRATVPL
jgi:hypothetical protein